MVVPDCDHQVSMGLIKMSSEEQSGGSNVKAGPIDKPLPYSLNIQPGIFGQAGQPDTVYLHHAVVFRSVPIDHSKTGSPALDCLDGGQNTGRQNVELRDEAHASEEWNRHRGTYVSCLAFEGKLSDAGFTLLEILVVVAILGLLIGLVAPAALRQLGGARVSIAKQSIERVTSVLDLYKLDTGSYPTTEQGITALIQRPAGVTGWSGPYLRNEAAPVDPWNRPYFYRSPSTRSGREIDVCSTGPKGDLLGDALLCN